MNIIEACPKGIKKKLRCVDTGVTCYSWNGEHVVSYGNTPVNLATGFLHKEWEWVEPTIKEYVESRGHIIFEGTCIIQSKTHNFAIQYYGKLNLKQAEIACDALDNLRRAF